MEEPSGKYVSSLVTRYCSPEMLYEHSDKNKFVIWRQLWIWLAESQRARGIHISQHQIDEMRNNRYNIDLLAAMAEQQITLSEVQAHANIFAGQCPSARSIINLGVSANFITENCDLIVMKRSANIVLVKIAAVIYHLKEFADTYKAVPTLTFMHWQKKQITTIGKRTCLWINDFIQDELALRRFHNTMKFLGVKGPIGNQAEILALLKGSHDDVKKLEMQVAKLCGFNEVCTITGQSYSRKLLVGLLAILSSVGTSIHKMCSDIRMLAFKNIMDESDSEDKVLKKTTRQIEKCCSLARHLITVYGNAASSHSVQMLEVTSDDSHLYRVTIPEAFLCADAALSRLIQVSKGLVVYPQINDRLIRQELPYIATDTIINAMTAAGAERSAVENKIRALINWTLIQSKHLGRDHNFLEQILSDPFFQPIRNDVHSILNPKLYIGRATEQVTDFLNNEVNPLLFIYGDKVMLA